MLLWPCRGLQSRQICTRKKGIGWHDVAKLLAREEEKHVPCHGSDTLGVPTEVLLEWTLRQAREIGNVGMTGCVAAVWKTVCGTVLCESSGWRIGTQGEFLHFKRGSDELDGETDFQMPFNVTYDHPSKLYSSIYRKLRERTYNGRTKLRGCQQRHEE